MEIKIDLRRHIKNMREQFQDRSRWVSEFIQNAQRSGATEITFDISPNSVSVWDNGSGCKDPDDLFTIAASGWEGLCGETPFGTGFYSVLGVASIVFVRSARWTALLDVTKLLDGDLDAVDIQSSDFYPGFFAEIRGSYLGDNIRDVIAKEGLYVPIRIRVDDISLPQESLYRSDNPLAVHVSSDLIEGFVIPANWGDVDTFHKYRRVSGLYRNACGRVTLKEAHPRCPDRTDWIRDKDFYAASDQLDDAIKAMYLSIWHRGISKEISLFGEAILRKVDQKELMKDHRFLMITKDGESFVCSDNKPKNGFFALEHRDADRVKKAVYLGFPIVVSSNVVEDALLKTWGLRDVEELEKNYKIACKCERSQAPEIQSVLNKIGQISGKPGSVTLAKIDATKSYCETATEPFPVSGICTGGVAYIQDFDEKFSARDFVMNRIVDIAHEVAHLFGYDDGDPNHDKKQIELIGLWLPKLDEITSADRKTSYV